MLRERKVRHPNWWVLHTVSDALHILHTMDLAMLETQHRLLRDFVAWKTSWGHHSDRANSREFQPQGMERLIHPFSAKVGRRKLFSSSYRKAGTDDHWINIFFLSLRKNRRKSSMGFLPYDQLKRPTERMRQGRGEGSSKWSCFSLHGWWERNSHWMISCSQTTFE